MSTIRDFKGQQLIQSARTTSFASPGKPNANTDGVRVSSTSERDEVMFSNGATLVQTHPSGTPAKEFTVFDGREKSQVKGSFSFEKVGDIQVYVHGKDGNLIQRICDFGGETMLDFQIEPGKSLNSGVTLDSKGNALGGVLYYPGCTSYDQVSAGGVVPNKPGVVEVDGKSGKHVELDLPLAFNIYQDRSRIYR